MRLDDYELAMAKDLIQRLRTGHVRSQAERMSNARAQIACALMLAKHGVDPDMESLAGQLEDLLAKQGRERRQKHHEHHEVETA